MELIPPSLTNTNDIIALGADKRFQFILFVSHTACVGVQAFQICLWALCAPRSSVNVPTSIATLIRIDTTWYRTLCPEVSFRFGLDNES